MDWNLKTPSWDLTDFEQETIPNIDLISGSSSFGGQGIKGNFSVDLQLGHQVVDSGDNLKVPNCPKMDLSPSGSLKRGRAINNGIQTASCLVDGCNADLSNCREYHRRHKVCELHSKTPEVTINGHKQRFCQQCSRFHSLEEFDEGKRSCRKRLDGHNRRRRKPQPEPLSRPGSFFTNQGPRLLQFSNPQVYPTTAVTNPIWAGIVKAEEDAKIYNQHKHRNNAFPESSSSSSSIDKRRKQLSFIHSTNLELSSNQASPQPSICQPLLNGFSSQFVNSDCALSLLSSSSSSQAGLSHVMQPNPIPVAHPFYSNPNYNSVEPMDQSILVPNVSDADVHCLGMFNPGPHHGSRGNETPQTLPFYWE